ncbi:MAG TPA: hypothetical protein VEM36_14430 [Xanthobacteraceae bacterium]|nr:hypothetical protein [Xanthobacteraceae bacterium]
MLALSLSAIAAVAAAMIFGFRNSPARRRPGYLSAHYRPERHYMRGPGPKWREKHVEARRDRR